MTVRKAAVSRGSSQALDSYDEYEWESVQSFQPEQSKKKMNNLSGYFQLVDIDDCYQSQSKIAGHAQSQRN